MISQNPLPRLLLQAYIQKYTHLHIGIFHYPIQIIQHLDIRRTLGMKPRQGIRRQDDLIIMLNQEVQHVRN